MISSFFAAPSAPGRELIALHTQHDTESFASSVLAGAEDDAELALDCQGRKHLDTSEDGDEVYVLQDNTPSSHMKFTMPGQATVNAFRDYLFENLQTHQITDSYGNECRFVDISNDHIAVLQAKMWTKSSTSRSPTKESGSRPSRAKVLTSCHIAKISHLLEGNHIFVLSETGHSTCHYLNGFQETADYVCHSPIVRIEPLVHWGTVIPATASLFMFTFRRDGSLMRLPAYKQLVRRLIDADAPAYCLDCLEYLWGKCAEAWDVVRRLKGAVSQVPTCSSDWVHHTSNCQASERSDPPVGESISSAVYVTHPAEAGMYDKARIVSKDAPLLVKPDKLICLRAPFQLDGTFDCLVTQSRAHANDKQSHCNVCELSDSGEDVDEHCEGSSSSRSNSFSLPLHTTPVKPKSPGNFPPPTGRRPSARAPTSTVPQVSSPAKDNPRTKNTYTTNKYGFRVQVQTPRPRTTERKFGREVDANSTFLSIPGTKSQRKDMEKAPDLGGNQPSIPVRPTKAVTPVKKAKDATEKPKKRKKMPTEPPAREKKILRPTFPQEHQPTNFTAHMNTTTGLPFPPDPDPTTPPPSPPKLIVHFARRPMNQHVPDGVSTLTHEAFQSQHPTPPSRICTCHTAAAQGPGKRNEVSQIVQCVNRECRVGWFHYGCLNQSEKGKARWGRFACVYCGSEEILGRGDRNKDGLHGGVARRWWREGVEGAMPGLGGQPRVRNPYGLGLEDSLLAHGSGARAKGLLGQLESWGYVQSKPYRLVQAYGDGDAYAQLAEDEAADYQQRETPTAEEEAVGNE